MDKDRRDEIHNQLRLMRAAHNVARWLMEDVVKEIQNAIDGKPLSIDVIRTKMQEYADAALVVDSHAILATIVASDDPLMIEETER